MAENANGSAGAAEMHAPTEHAKFTIGGKEIKVPAPSLYHLSLVKEELFGLGPELDFVDYGLKVVTIIGTIIAPEGEGEPQTTVNRLIRECSSQEMHQLPFWMNELFKISGLGGANNSGEAAAMAENPGTGTSTPSPQNLPPTEFVPETSAGSNEATL